MAMLIRDEFLDIRCVESDNEADAWALFTKIEPDFVVLDLELVQSNGFSLLQTIKSHNVRTPVLVVTMHEEVEYLSHAFSLGANGYVSKRDKPEVLLKGIHCILRGEKFLSDLLSSAMITHLKDGGEPSSKTVLTKLTSREQDVFLRLGQSFSSQEIGDHLGISFRTVDTHIERIRAKLGLESRHKLICLAVKVYQELPPDFKEMGNNPPTF
jgi:DNA-binding NarL/FixJ family response regulator